MRAVIGGDWNANGSGGVEVLCKSSVSYVGLYHTGEGRAAGRCDKHFDQSK
jgi:hypothetical protein